MIAARRSELRDPLRPTSHASRGIWLPTLAVVVASALIGLIGLRGADYPAQLLRALLWQRAGASVWNTYWYAGHATPTYSIITPPLASLVGPFPLVVLSSLVATYCFAMLTTTLRPGRSTGLANFAFALCAIVNVIVGRTAFALGLALALMTLWLWRRWPRAAALVAVVTALASPVAATCLAIATFAVGVDRLWRDRTTARDLGVPVAVGATTRQALWLTLASLLPIAVLGALFSSTGRFPFRGDQLVFSLAAIAIVAAVVPLRPMRIGAACAAFASLVLFLVPNPLGGNFLRLTQSVALPLAITALPAVKRTIRPLFVVALLAGTVWSLQPGIAAALSWYGDDSVDAGYHQPLIDQVRERNRDGRPIGRLEIPFTDNHWESFFVAPAVPYARGWERQVDLDRNGELYDEDLTTVEYHDWLLDNAVRWIAVADVTLDEGGRPEGSLIEREGTARDIAWLRLVWRNADWRLYEVLDYQPIVDPPARLVRQDADRFVISTPVPGDITIRFEFTDEVTADRGACVEATEGGWIVAHLPDAGTYTIGVEPESALPGADTGLCSRP